jgi:hypothetical protein
VGTSESNYRINTNKTDNEFSREAAPHPQKFVLFAVKKFPSMILLSMILPTIFVP